MIAAGLVFGLVAVALVAWWAVRYFGEFGKHAGGGKGALTVEQLLDQAAAEDNAGGRHRLPLVIRGDLAEDLTVVETRLLPPASAPTTHGWACDLDVLRELYAGLQKL